MKQILLISVMVLTLIGYGYTQMGGMMGGQSGQGRMDGGMMSGQQSQMGQSGMMMQDQGMSGGMMQMMNKMGNMMQRMSGMMGEGLGPEDMKKISEITRDMSTQMMDMSNMFQTGEASQKDMQRLQQRMMETEKRLNMLMR